MKLFIVALTLVPLLAFAGNRAGTKSTRASKADTKRIPASVGGEDKNNYQQVRGHIKSDGTYVAPYIRTSPNGTTYDNIRPRK
jgi:hypothetical protein